ncbi:MAG: hypothetical protein ACLPWF_27050 [Bryobacteraceae bacterium]|jgi:hypothetical protein
MSRVFDRHWLMEGVARQMRRQAANSPCYTGITTPQNLRLLNSLTADHLATGTRLIFSRDAGHHSSGWWKNPDYERCWHLSMSFLEPLTGKPRDKDVKLTNRWLEAFYGENRRYVWSESPYSPDGKARNVWHYRVFCDPAWQPIVPRGEVYSRELTEAGWLSFSDLQGEHSRALAALEPLPGEM